MVSIATDGRGHGEYSRTCMCDVVSHSKWSSSQASRLVVPQLTDLRIEVGEVRDELAALKVRGVHPPVERGHLAT